MFGFQLGGVLGDIFHKNVYGQGFLFIELYVCERDRERERNRDMGGVQSLV